MRQFITSAARPRWSRLAPVLALIGLCLAPAGAQARYASIVVDFETGRTLYGINADTRNYPASLAKMMTLYMAFEALRKGNLTLDQELPVSRRAAGMAPSKLGLKAGGTITVKDVILALVTKSANDAAVVMAEALGTKETRFARMMTKKARALGMKRTNFRNASGLPNRRQLSTARDLAILARSLIRDFPRFYEFFATGTFTYNGRTFRNHNSLLKKYDGADGLKTGYIRASGFNLAASAVRNGRRLVAVVLGGKSPRSRDRQIARLLNKGFAKLAETRVAAAPPSAQPRRKPATTPKPARPRATARPPVPTKAAKVAKADGRGNGTRIWGIQVGAYYRYELAENAAIKAAARLPRVLERSKIFVPNFRGKRGRIYRARLVGLTESNARAACRRLKTFRTDCLVVQVRAAALALGDTRSNVASN